MIDVFSDFSRETEGFSDKFKSRHGEVVAKVDELNAAINGNAEVKAKLEGFKTAEAEAKTALDGLAKDVKPEVVAQHQKALDDAQKATKNYLSGKAEGAKAPENISKLFGEAEKATSDVTKTMASKITGRLKTTGFAATLKHNGQDMKNAFTKAGEGKRMLGFGRIAATTAGAGFVVHGLAKSQTADGEKRSILGRAVEVAAGGALIYGGTLGGAFAR